MACATLDSLGRRRHAGLVTKGGTHRTHTRSHDQGIRTQQLTHVVSLHRRAHDAIDAVGLSELCQAGGLLGHGRLDADLAQGILIHAREHGDGDELGAVLARLLGTLAAGSEHGARTQAVNREQVGTGK